MTFGGLYHETFPNSTRTQYYYAAFIMNDMM